MLIRVIIRIETLRPMGITFKSNLHSSVSILSSRESNKLFVTNWKRGGVAQNFAD